VLKSSFFFFLVSCFYSVCIFESSECLNDRFRILHWEKGEPNRASSCAAQVSLLIKNGKREGNSHRGHLDIIADILDASRGGVKRTYLMNQCNLSFRQLKSYSHFLVDKGFLRVMVRNDELRHQAFEVTEKGREFLRAYGGLKSLMH
jgi:predicted transcriptional regulator